MAGFRDAGPPQALDLPEAPLAESLGERVNRRVVGRHDLVLAGQELVAVEEPHYQLSGRGHHPPQFAEHAVEIVRRQVNSIARTGVTARDCFTGIVIQTLDDLAEASRREVESIPVDVREDLGARILIGPAAGPETGDRLRDEAVQVGDAAAAEAFGLDHAEFVSFASNGSGDPFGVAPETAQLNPAGSILHLNHDTGRFAVVATDLSSFLIGLGNYGECWDPESDVPEEVAGRRLQGRLEALGWTSELRRYWPGVNENGAFD